MFYSDGTKYIGEWKAGKKNGQGWEDFKSGNVYEGNHVDNQREGQGTMTYTDGTKYKGEWKAGKKNGHGWEDFKSGNVYEGNHVDN